VDFYKGLQVTGEVIKAESSEVPLAIQYGRRGRVAQGRRCQTKRKRAQKERASKTKKRSEGCHGIEGRHRKIYAVVSTKRRRGRVKTLTKSLGIENV